MPTAFPALSFGFSSVLDPDQSAAEAEWFEFSYSPADPSDLLVSSTTVFTDRFPAVCDIAPPNSAGTNFSVCLPSSAPFSGDWALSFKSKMWNGALDSDGWRVKAISHDVTIAAASDLSTPFDQISDAMTSGISKEITSELGISSTSPWGRSISETDSGDASTWGLSVRTNSGLEVIGTSAGVQAYQHLMIASIDLFAGITPVGPLVGTEAPFGALSISAAALDLDGRFQAAATISLQMGDLKLSYVAEPAGTGIVGTVNQPFHLGFSVDSSDVGVTLAADLGDGGTLRASGSGRNGFQIVFIASISLENPVTVSHGPSVLSLTPQLGSSTPGFRWRLFSSVPKLPRPSLPPATALPSSTEEGDASQGTDDETP